MMRKITYALSIITLAVILFDSAGAFDNLKRSDIQHSYSGVSINKIIAVDDGIVYLVTLTDGIWCMRKGAARRVLGVVDFGYLANVDKHGNSLFLATLDKAYEISDCHAIEIQLPQSRTDR